MRRSFTPISALCLPALSIFLQIQTFFQQSFFVLISSAVHRQGKKSQCQREKKGRQNPHAITRWFNFITLEEEESDGVYLYNRLTSLNLGGENRTVSENCLSGFNYFEMPIRRKRSSPTMEDSRSKRAKMSSWSRRAAETDTAFSSKRCITWFHEYTDADEDTLGPEGMEKFCEDIGVEPENIVMLCLAWKLNAVNMGFFTKAEWLKGMSELQCDNVYKLQQKLDYLKALLDDPVHFKNIYRYAFDFARDKDQRSMDIDTSKAMLALLLGKHWPLFSSFHQYLEQSKYKVINKDQWCNVLEFSRTILPDLSNYDEDGAWPVLLDDFVEWFREHNKLPTSMTS